MPNINLTLANGKASVEQHFGTADVAPGDTQGLAHLLKVSLEQFETFTGREAKNIVFTVEDFGDNHTSTGYT